MVVFRRVCSRYWVLAPPVLLVVAACGGSTATAKHDGTGGVGTKDAGDIVTGGSSGGGHATGGESTGGAATGGVIGVAGSPDEGTGGLRPSGGTNGTGATGGNGDATGGRVQSSAGASGTEATGGAGGTGGFQAAATAGAAAVEERWMTEVPPIADIAIATDGAGCAPPCGTTMTPNEAYIGGAEGLTLLLDLDTGQSLLVDDPSAAPAGLEPVMSFTWEPGDYGYGAWVTSPSYWIFSDNYVYGDGYSLRDETLMRAQIAVGESHRPVIVVHSFGAEHGVRIHDVHLASCDPTAERPCENADDCPAVEGGERASLSDACAACYVEVASCSANACPTECPGQGGNACLVCETDAECHKGFMACSGLDYMPPGTLTLPNW